MKTALFDYDLPRELIAQHPAEQRDRSRLLVLDRATGDLEHGIFADLPGHVGAGDVLVVNDTRVIPARLYGKRETGGRVAVLLVRRATEQGRAVDGGEVWEALLNARGRLRDGETVSFPADLTATLLGRSRGGASLVELRCQGDLRAVIERIGRAPLPPYIKRPRTGDVHAEADAERYQTIYARKPGAVAAPTAGLHFTPELLDAVVAAGCQVASVTLHVGPGTFKPVTAEEAEEHRVDAEAYVCPEETARAVNAAERVIAVGTTTTRVLETLGRAGRESVAAGEGWTDLFIYPRFEFKVVDALITNFHLPRSSLLMLVSAFAGRERILAAYEKAKERDYRFYSYGDAMLIL
jgi:S-adenosylmethionine:tRNA ribosyltransferase-isomerase